MHCTYLHAAQFNLLSNIVQTAVCNPWFTVTCNGYFILFYCYIFVTFVTDFSVMFVSVLWVRFRNNNNDDTDNYSVWCSAVTYSRTLFLHLYCSFTQVQQVQYKLCSTVHRCLQHKATQYMMDCCIHTSDIARRQHLRSASCSYRDTGVRCSVVGPFLWLARPSGTR